MKHIVYKCSGIISCLLLLPGCGRLLDWGKGKFYQGEPLVSTLDVPRKQVRSVVVYDQLSTVGMFDALWLSDEIKTAYTDDYALKYAKSPEIHKAFLRRQLEENKHYIMFYVLCRNEDILGDPDSLWSIFMKIDNRIFSPLEVKIVDMVDPIYQAFFGKKWSMFKDAYLVKFDTHDADDNPVIRPDTQHMYLWFRSLTKEAFLRWDLVPCTLAQD